MKKISKESITKFKKLDFGDGRLKDKENDNGSQAGRKQDDRGLRQEKT